MFWLMKKNLITKDTYDARDAGLHNSTVQIESPRRRMSRILASIRLLRAYIHWSPPSIEDDLQIKVAQIMKKNMFIFGRDHNL